MRKTLIALLVSSLCLASLPAGADDVKDAKAKFTAGAKAYREARYKEAIDLFLAANELDPHPELIFNVGQAFEKLGDVPNALRSYREYLRKAPTADDRATVETSIRNLEQRLREKGLQQVSVYSNPVGATVYLDSKKVGATPWTGEIGPGRHQITLRATGFPDHAKEFVLTGDRAMDIDMDLSKATVPGAPVDTAAPPASAAPAVTTAPVAADKPVGTGPVAAPKTTIGVGTWVAFAAGVVGLGAAGGLEMARKGAEDAARDDPTQIGRKDKYDTMLTNQTASRVMLGVGAAGLAAGAVLLVLDLRRPQGDAVPGKTTGKAAATARLGAGCTGAGCWLSASGSF